MSTQMRSWIGVATLIFENCHVSEVDRFLDVGDSSVPGDLWDHCIPSFTLPLSNQGKGFHCRGLSWCWALTPEQLGLASPVADNIPCEGCIMARSRWWRFFAHDLGRRTVWRFMWGSAMFKSHSHSPMFILIYVAVTIVQNFTWPQMKTYSWRLRAEQKLARALTSSSYISWRSKMYLYKYLCSFENHIPLDHLDTSHLHLQIFDFRRRALKEYT